MAMRSDIVLLMYHGIDWHFPPARQQYLAKAFARYCRVVYLDGGRDSRFKISSYRPDDNVTVIRGLVAFLSALGRRGVRFGLRSLAGALLRPYLRSHDTVILWAMGANAYLLSLLPYDFMVFDCMDPCFEDDPRVQAQFDREEKEALSKADIVFASAWSLLDRCQREHPRAYLLNNACAPEDYTTELIARSPRPEWWPHTRKPIAAYLGTLDWRFDFELAGAVANLCLDVHFVFAGRQLKQFFPQLDQLMALANVTCPGALDLEQGRYLAANCDVGIVPFKLGAMNDCVNPVKMYLYALLGKTVIGTAVRELTGRPGVAVTARNAQEFAHAIRRGLDLAGDPGHVRHLKCFGLENTWAHRAADAWTIMCSELGLCTSSPPVAGRGREAEELREQMGRDGGG